MQVNAADFRGLVWWFQVNAGDFRGLVRWFQVNAGECRWLQVSAGEFNFYTLRNKNTLNDF